MMMAFGMFVFSLSTVAYQGLQQQIGWRHPATSRIGQRPARQYLGHDDETITLNGVLLPELSGGEKSLTALRLLGDQGKAWPLIEGTGKLYGLYVLESLDMTRSVFFNDGSARRIEFSMTLKRVDDYQKLGEINMLTQFIHDLPPR
ncbi:MAG: phage tail protein [Ottowia sp.]|nr:phage tail protein [Ottowia sp.]